MAENLQSKQVIAKIFGVSTRRVEQLKEEGVKNFGIHAMLASCSLENIYYPMLAEELFIPCT